MNWEGYIATPGRVIESSVPDGDSEELESKFNMASFL